MFDGMLWLVWAGGRLSGARRTGVLAAVADGPSARLFSCGLDTSQPSGKCFQAAWYALIDQVGTFASLQVDTISSPTQSPDCMPFP